MKKLIFILSLSLILLCGIFFTPHQNNFSLSNYFSGTTMYTYTNECINQTSTKITNTYMSLSSKGATTQNLLGESMFFDNLEVNSALKTLKATVKFTEYLSCEQLTIIYGYSPLIDKNKVIKNNLVNIQIAISNEYTIIGWPVIYGSF